MKKSNFSVLTWKFALHTSCCLLSQWKWPIYQAWLVEYKVQLAPFAVNAIKKSKWSFSLRDRVRCKYVFVEFAQVFATWSYTKKVSKFWKISNLTVLGSFTYVENDSEVIWKEYAKMQPRSQHVFSLQEESKKKFLNCSGLAKCLFLKFKNNTFFIFVIFNFSDRPSNTSSTLLGCLKTARVNFRSFATGFVLGACIRLPRVVLKYS